MVSAFPTSPISTLWRAIVSALQTDPVLGAQIELWQVWQGEDIDLVDVTSDNLPFLRITPKSSPQDWLDEAAAQITFTLEIKIGVSGTDVTALFDAWHAVHTALFTGNTVLNALYPLGVIQKTITQAAIVPAVYDGASGLEGTGLLRIKTRINS